MLRHLTLIAVVSVIAGPAIAYCSEPSAPSCATRYGSFDDEGDFDTCRRKMTSYRSEVEQFISCQNDEIRKARAAADDEVRKARNAAEEALQEYENTVERFNRRAKG